MVDEAPLEQTGTGLVPKGDGWFVLNAGTRAGTTPTAARRTVTPMAMYHWEADQEDFLVLSGEALLIVEGEERPLRAFDFVHCPPETRHVIVGAGDGPCVVVAVGARDRSVDSPDW